MNQRPVLEHLAESAVRSLARSHRHCLAPRLLVAVASLLGLFHIDLRASRRVPEHTVAPPVGGIKLRLGASSQWWPSIRTPTILRRGPGTPPLRFSWTVGRKREHSSSPPSAVPILAAPAQIHGLCEIRPMRIKSALVSLRGGFCPRVGETPGSSCLKLHRRVMQFTLEPVHALHASRQWSCPSASPPAWCNRPERIRG